jgi:hypothetical protein
VKCVHRKWLWLALGFATQVIACSRVRRAAPPSKTNDAVDAATRTPALIDDDAMFVHTAPKNETLPVNGCEELKDVYLFTSPATPWVGAPLRVMAVSDRPIRAELTLTPAKATLAESTVAASTNAGPPYAWTAEIERPHAGAYDAVLTQPGCENPAKNAAKRISVVAWKPGPPALPKTEAKGLWPTFRAWNHGLENVYSAWIERLFDAPDLEMPSWPALHEVLRDRKRNFLFDHLAGAEDSANTLIVRPDCADLPYFLRAYFAFKLRLPFGVSECDRGGSGAPPKCKANVLHTNENEPSVIDEKTTALSLFGTFLKGKLADKAHSGSARQPFDEANSDYYPVALSWNSLRPGTIFADPYGHVLMVSKRVPQTSERGGILLAVDGQPDGTVARKRYWRGNFLYATAKELGGPGWKRFRPIELRNGTLVRLSDDAIAKHPSYGDVSREATALDVEAFYDRLEDILSPRPLDPKRAMLETLDALEEQVQTRVRSVDNGRKWLASAHTPALMPEGASIFEATGAWEDFSTPSRDLRILIAADVVKGFPARVARRPDRFAMPEGYATSDVTAALERILARELRTRNVHYTRTDGSSFPLSVQDVIERSEALEMAYNPNDCVEARWGAPSQSQEMATCSARAPADQTSRMQTYRPWFHERRRPARP